MSIKILFGFLDTIDILLLLREDEFIMLSRIQAKFSHVDPQNIYRKLEKLAEQSIVLKQNLKKAGKRVEPGGCKVEYKLSPRGADVKKEVIKKALKMFEPVIDATVKKKIQEQEAVKYDHMDEEIIQDFIMEFSEEVSESCDDAMIRELQRMLKKLLEKYFF